MSKVIVVTSGKGGVGKTTTSASIATGLAMLGKKVVVIDFDVGLRNLDLIMGCERRVIYDLVNVAEGSATLKQALVKDSRIDNLYILAASQTRDKDTLTQEGVGQVIDNLQRAGVDYIVCDSPAGIEKGAQMALYFADEAIVVVNPEMASVRDADRMLGILQTRSKRAETGALPIKEHLVVTRYLPERVESGAMLSVDKVIELLGIKLLGVVPESEQVMRASNAGNPVILTEGSEVSEAYSDIVQRLLGKDAPHRFMTTKKKGFMQRLFG